MYKRYYDSYHTPPVKCKNNEEIIFNGQTDEEYIENRDDPKKNESVTVKKDCIQKDVCHGRKNSFSLPGELDDIILIGILLLLINDKDSPDPVMLAIIGFMLFSDSISL